MPNCAMPSSAQQELAAAVREYYDDFLGAVLFLVFLPGAGSGRGEFLGASLGLAAGAFICIAAADLLPEVEFHSHDRLLLSASLALGITVAAGITVAERGILAPSRGVAAALPGSGAR
jgi:hypothetical protein